MNKKLNLFLLLIMKMKSLTLDNIIYDDNKNKQKISGDNQGENGIAKFNFYFDGNYKHKIKRNIIDNLKIPHYIKIGSECPICYDEIYNRNNALLTDCGHSFHYSCIINYDYKNTIKIVNNFKILSFK